MTQGSESSASRERIELVIELDETRDLDSVEKLDLDRVPDPEGRVRVLVSEDQLRQLQQDGFTVELQQRIPVEALDPSLVYTDDDARAWVESRLEGLPREREAE